MGDEQRCPNKQISVEILQSIYMLIANVLLLNLLIALFSSTYGKSVIQIQTSLPVEFSSLDLKSTWGDPIKCIFEVCLTSNDHSI